MQAQDPPAKGEGGQRREKRSSQFAATSPQHAKEKEDQKWRGREEKGRKVTSSLVPVEAQHHTVLDCQQSWHSLSCWALCFPSVAWITASKGSEERCQPGFRHGPYL